MLTLENGARLARHWAPFLWFLFTFFSAKSAEICLSSALGQWRGNNPPPHTHTHTQKCPKKEKGRTQKKRFFNPKNRKERERPPVVRSVGRRQKWKRRRRKKRKISFFFSSSSSISSSFSSSRYSSAIGPFLLSILRPALRRVTFFFFVIFFSFFLSFFFCHLPTRSFDSITYRVWDWLLPGLQSVAPDRVLLGFARFNFWLIDYYWVLLGFIRVLQSFLAFT